MRNARATSLRAGPAGAPASAARRRLALAVPLLCGLGWGGLARAAVPVQRASFELMGTRVDVVAQASDATQAARAVQAAAAEMARRAALLSRYEPASLISRINAQAGGQAVAVPRWALDIFRDARGVSLKTAGAFDVTVGALRGWEFKPGQGRVPPDSVIECERRLIDFRGVELDEYSSTVRLSRTGMALDLGGIAKLPILQAGMDVLAAHGVRDALVNGGGDVLIAGRLQGRPWRVGLRDAREPRRLLGVVALEGRAVVASSGDYERCFMAQGRLMHHILDPRTGRPTQGPHGVSLLARDVAAVNGLGAAAMVLGLPRGRALLQAQPGVESLIAARDGTVWQSAGMAACLLPAQA